MPGQPRHRSPDRSRRRASSSGQGSLRLVRDCHIFAAAVREVMEKEPLRDACAAPLSLSQFMLLKLLARTGAKQVGEVAELLGVSPPAATKIVDKLERLELVTRSPSRGDRRATLVMLCPGGWKVVQRYEAAKQSQLLRAMSRFSEAELARFSESLEALSVSLLDGHVTNDGPCLRCAVYVENDCPIGRLLCSCPVEVGGRGGRPTVRTPVGPPGV